MLEIKLPPVLLVQKEARGLPDTDNFLCNIKKCFGSTSKDVTDPYVAVQLDSTRIITTSVKWVFTFLLVARIPGTVLGVVLDRTALFDILPN